MINIALLLDKAKVIHTLPSDYKLALVMGVQPTSLANYRTGKTLPDARVIAKICELTGDDPMVLAAQCEAERAKTSEARKLWEGIAMRLQSGAASLASIAFAVTVSIFFSMVSGVSDVQAMTLPASNLVSSVCILCKVK